MYCKQRKNNNNILNFHNIIVLQNAFQLKKLQYDSSNYHFTNQIRCTTNHSTKSTQETYYYFISPLKLAKKKKKPNNYYQKKTIVNRKLKKAKFQRRLIVLIQLKCDLSNTQQLKQHLFNTKYLSQLNINNYKKVKTQGILNSFKQFDNNIINLNNNQFLNSLIVILSV
eukprot:EC097495.1.p1 GENE.EC097495.1~~EC097495.1.p1  ORF type:complete len:169 (-),score=12.27 EC097495.1:44-550(-)